MLTAILPTAASDAVESNWYLSEPHDHLMRFVLPCLVEELLNSHRPSHAGALQFCASECGDYESRNFRALVHLVR